MSSYSRVGEELDDIKNEVTNFWWGLCLAERMLLLVIHIKHLSKLADPPFNYRPNIHSRNIWKWAAPHFQSCSISSAQKYTKGNCSWFLLLKVHGTGFESQVADRHLFIMRNVIRSGPGQHYTWQIICIILGTTCSQIPHVHKVLLKLFYNPHCLLK